MTTQITVIGLDQTGASIGMALADYKETILRCCHDEDSARMKNLEKEGAFDKSFTRMTDAVREADVIILALRLDQVKDALAIIAKNAKMGVIIMDTSVIHSAVSSWAREILPQGMLFISAMPVINYAYLNDNKNDEQTPHADLFEKGDMAIASEHDTDPKAIKMVSDLSELLKAKPFFIDPLEADGFAAEVEQLPKLGNAALFNTLISEPGWKDARRLTSKAFFRAGSFSDLMDEKEFLGISALMNKENVSRILGQYINSLIELKQWIDEEDEDAIRGYLKKARTGLDQWSGQRANANWDAVNAEQFPLQRNILGRLFGSKPKKED